MQRTVVRRWPHAFAYKHAHKHKHAHMSWHTHIPRSKEMCRHTKAVHIHILKPRTDTHTNLRLGILAKTPGASDAMFFWVRSRVPTVSEQDPPENSCQASSSEKVQPPNVAMSVRVAVGGGVQIATAVVASFVRDKPLLDVVSAGIAALLCVADTHEQT